MRKKKKRKRKKKKSSQSVWKWKKGKKNTSVSFFLVFSCFVSFQKDDEEKKNG